MKKVFIIANWKSNIIKSEASSWLQKFQISNIKFPIPNKEVVVCPPFTLLSILKLEIGNLKLDIKLGAQDISSFGPGSYTGEINGEQIKEFAEYVIIGHSERRINFGETEEIINKKIMQAINNQLTPIVCISDQSQILNLKSQIHNLKLKSLNKEIVIAYEPLFAIGTGKPDTPENADNMAAMIKKELGEVLVLYGGSINPENVNSFTKMSNINGVLVGKTSLNPQKFLKLTENA